MDIILAALYAIAIIVGVPVALIFVTLMVGLLSVIGMGIVVKAFDFFMDAVAGKESTKFDDGAK